MPYLMVFVCGVVVGRSWDVVKAAVAPVVGGASSRFDALYANTARTIVTRIEDAEDRRIERRYRAVTQLPN